MSARSSAHRWLAGAVVALCLPVETPAQTAADEYRLKAAFVYRFPQFVQWPTDAVRGAQTFDLCLLPPNPFGSDLTHLTNGERLNGRPLRVRVIARADAAAECHALFASARTAPALTAGALKAAAGRPVLTIGESAEFLNDGGIIVLRLVDRRVRFDVHAANALKAGLRIDAQLLALAAAVHGGAR